MADRGLTGAATSERVSGAVASSRAGLPDTIVHSVWIVPGRSGSRQVAIDRGQPRHGAMRLALEWLLRPRFSRFVPGLRSRPTLIVHETRGDRVLPITEEPYQPSLRREPAVEMPRPTLFSPASVSDLLVLDDGTEIRAYAQSEDAGLTVKCDLYVDGESLEYPGLPLAAIDERLTPFRRKTPRPYLHVVAGIVGLLVATTAALSIVRAAPLDWTRFVAVILPFPAVASALDWWLRTAAPPAASRVLLPVAVLLAIACAGLLGLVVVLPIVAH